MKIPCNQSTSRQITVSLEESNMENLIIFVKLNISAPAVSNAIDYVKQSYSRNEQHYYYTSVADTTIVKSLLETQGIGNLVDKKIVFILYRKTTKVYIKELYVGQITDLGSSDNSYIIYYQITNKIDSRLVIDNFMRFSNLSIERDFTDKSHISIEDSVALMQQIMYATETPRSFDHIDRNYEPLDSEQSLSEFAQKNQYCDRFYNILSPSQSRGEFQRDYDRIIHCKAFRRMVDKAQIFSSCKGDHYRTRMTHTLCVAQIARGIATRLKMNIPLTEAIALGHDLGHTPFGHQGERTLDKLVKENGITGFKHNFQSLKVASILEEEYVDVSGLDLSVQTLEGMWKHTKIRKSQETPLLCDLHDFIPADVAPAVVQKLHEENSFCATLEGQIVAIADEIAQRSHDLDDALSAGLLTIDGLLEVLSLKKLHQLRDQINELKETMEQAQKDKRFFVSKSELLAARISSQVIHYFIDDVVHTFETFAISDDAENLREYFNEHKCVNRQVINFSPEGKVLNDYMETIVTKQVINSSEVAAFDDKAMRIVTALFNLYYDNPRLLHNGTLQRIYREMRQITPNAIHFQDGDIALVNDEWSRIKDPENAMRLCDLQENFPGDDLSRYDRFSEFKDQLNPEDPNYNIVTNYIESKKEEYTKKKKILICAICDFISGMTDSYAMNEYRKLLL